MLLQRDPQRYGTRIAARRYHGAVGGRPAALSSARRPQRDPPRSAPRSGSPARTAPGITAAQRSAAPAPLRPFPGRLTAVLLPQVADLRVLLAQQHVRPQPRAVRTICRGAPGPPGRGCGRRRRAALLGRRRARLPHSGHALVQDGGLIDERLGCGVVLLQPLQEGLRVREDLLDGAGHGGRRRGRAAHSRGGPMPGSARPVPRSGQPEPRTARAPPAFPGRAPRAAAAQAWADPGAAAEPAPPPGGHAERRPAAGWGPAGSGAGVNGVVSKGEYDSLKGLLMLFVLRGGKLTAETAVQRNPHRIDVLTAVL